MTHLTFEERKLVVSVAEFFQLEKDSSSLINVNNVARRTAEACLVSESTAKRCRREAEKESKEIMQLTLRKSNLAEEDQRL